MPCQVTKSYDHVITINPKIISILRFIINKKNLNKNYNFIKIYNNLKISKFKNKFNYNK